MVYLNKEIFRCSKGRFAAYSYRERPNIGVLAGAAVKAGWVALEECWSQKEGVLSAKGLYHGRADLWLWRDVQHGIGDKSNFGEGWMRVAQRE
jgi:hypothetical protein